MVDAIRLVQAIGQVMAEDKGVSLSSPAFAALLIAFSYLLLRQFQRL